jgi:hypothetical protein
MRILERLKEPLSFLELLGPLTVLCAVALCPLLTPVALIGLALSFYFRMRGFAYALVLIGVGAFVSHALLTEGHLWRFGLELSLACSFWMVALAQEEEAASQRSVASTLETRSLGLQNLEEELTREKEHRAQTQISSDTRLGELQTRLDEIEKDHSSILVLNEVLRKTTARHIEEKVDLERRTYFMRQEIDVLTKTNPPRDELMSELNAARIAREQTHLINETLVRLHAEKCRELEQIRNGQVPDLKTLSLYSQLRKQFDEKNEMLHLTRKELFEKQTQLEAVLIEKDQMLPSSDSFAAQMDRETEEMSQELLSLREETLQLEELIRALMKPSATKSSTPPPARKKKKK